MTSPTATLIDHPLKALRVSESRYCRLFESARDGILILNAHSAQIEDVNPYLIELLGYSHAEFVGKKLWEVGPFSDRAESKEMFAQLQAKGYVRYDNLPLKTKSRTNIDVEFVSNAYDCEGIMVVQCNIRDVTERNKANQRFKDLLEFAPDAMVIVNRDAEIVLVNAQAVNLFGWRREELLGQKIEILMPERFRARHSENQKGFFAQPRARAMGSGLELFGLHKDGSEFPVEISVSPLGTDEGTQVMSAIRDISERKLVEETAHANENRLRVALSNINMAVFHQDLSLRYTWMYHPQLGYLPEQVVGHTDAELISPERARRITELKQRVLDKGEIVHEEIDVAVKDATFSLLISSPSRCAVPAAASLVSPV